LRFHRAVGSRLVASVPACLGGLVDQVNDTGILLLEDIAPAEQGDVLASCTDEQALAAVRSLARVHALSRAAATEEHASEAPSWQATVATADVWDARLSAAAARFPQILTPSLVDRLHKLSRLVGPAIESLRRRDTCWIHSDAHLDNVLFRPDGTAVLLDWSGASIGPAAVDLARLLTECVDAGARRERRLASSPPPDVGIPGQRCRTASRPSFRLRSRGLLGTRPESHASECGHCR
jgi:Ser/Thr protein kinase RdoA (MazF antagonist)